VSPRTPRSPFLLASLLLLAGCMPSNTPSTTPNTGAGLPPEILFCRTQSDRTSTSEIALRTAQNLGTAHLSPRPGRQLHVRVHPDGARIVFTRERTLDQPTSRDLVLSSLDGSVHDTQITTNNVPDDTPCWSPTGDRILFATARDGDSRLYVAAANGQNQQPFLSADPGVDDRDPDWCRTTDRIVFSRRDATGLRRLMLVNGDGTGLVPLTLGSPATAGDTETGDRDAAFSPDGQRVLFVRLAGPGSGLLAAADVGTGAVTVVFDPQGGVRLPRFSPAGDRIFCGVDERAAGRDGLRLCALHADGTEPLLVEPGRQWLLDGIDVLPALGPAPPAAAAEVVDVTTATIEIASGNLLLGGTQQLVAQDNSELVVGTATFNGREVAGINCRFHLPVLRVEDVLGLRMRIVARVTRADGGTALRSSLHNPVASRFDTVAEIDAPGTGAHVLTFTTQSLAHVTMERDVRFTVIGDISPGASAELHVDQVQLELIRRAP
jgi:dipeptidyl aminopeptidase/acylaminoacyl peptidase